MTKEVIFETDKKGKKLPIEPEQVDDKILSEHDALDYYDINDKDFETKMLQVPIIEAKDKDEKILGVRRISQEFRMTMEGKQMSDDGKYYVQTGKALLGAEPIKLLCSGLDSYSQEANLISSKDIDKFNIQFIDSFIKANNHLLRERTVKEKVYRYLDKLFKDKMCNVGDIITNNKSNMDSVMGRVKEQPNNFGFGNPLSNNGMNNINMGKF